MLLPFVKFPRLLNWLESKRSYRRIQEDELRSLIRILNKITRYRYFLIRNNCLRKNLVFYYFLIRAGVKGVRIHIGISKKDSKLDGHCWLTLDGALFQDTEESVSKYAVIYSSGV